MFKVTQSGERRFQPWSEVFCNGYYFLSAARVCGYPDSGLKREHGVSRKLASHPLEKEGRKGWLCPGCAPGRGGCNLCVASSEQRVLVSPVIPEDKAGTKEEIPGRQKVCAAPWQRRELRKVVSCPSLEVC